MAKKTVAVRIAEAIKADLDDRRGMWPDDLSRDIEREIHTSWIRAIETIITEEKSKQP